MQSIELATRATVGPEGEPISPEPARPPVPLTAEARETGQKAAIQLLEDAMTRVEQELRDAERAGDKQGAQVARVRLGRLREVRAKRVRELEQPRAP